MKGNSVKHLMRALICASIGVFFLGCQDNRQESVTTGPETDREKISYAIGVDMSMSVERIKDEVDLPMLQKGMSDHYNGKEILVSKEEAQPLLQALSERLAKKQQEEFTKTGQENLEKGLAFLNENRSAEGVETTESGLQYKVIKEGTGKSPKSTDRIKVHYKGTRLDGTVFDSSYERGEPVTFQANQVISGWTEAVQLMKEGGSYKLFIPSDLAYGERGAGQDIGPNEVLVFEIELLEVIYDQPSEEGVPGQE